MIIFAFLLILIFYWPLFKILQKGWRLLLFLFLAALIDGCASTSNKFGKSPCACDFQNINTGNYGSKVDA